MAKTNFEKYYLEGKDSKKVKAEDAALAKETAENAIEAVKIDLKGTALQAQRAFNAAKVDFAQSGGDEGSLSRVIAAKQVVADLEATKEAIAELEEDLWSEVDDDDEE